MYENFPKPDKQLKHALENRIPFVIWVGEDEVLTKLFKIKIMYSKTEIVVAEDTLVEQATALSAKFADDFKKGLINFNDKV